MDPRIGAGPRRLGLGIVGASRFARFCLDAYSTLDDLVPVSIWSRTGRSADRFADETGLAAQPSLAHLVADPAVDVVHIATVPSQHAQQSRQALSAGKDVLVEKPLATSREDARMVLDTAEQAGRTVSVNFMMRYGPLWEPVKGIVDSRVLGDCLHGVVLNLAGDDGLPEDHWFWDEQTSGGIFVEHAVHFFDLMRSWLGEGNVISANSAARPGDGHVDQVGCVVRYRSGATVSQYHGFHQSRYLDRQEVRLVFELGELRVTGWVADRLEVVAIVDEAGAQLLREQTPPGATVTIEDLDGDRVASRRSGRRPVAMKVGVAWHAGADQQETYREALRALMADFLESCRDRDHVPRVRGRDGEAALALALAATAMARSSS